MSDFGTELRQAFLGAGWEVLDSNQEPDHPAINGFFVGGFATCALVLARDVSTVAENWRDVQGVLVQLLSERVIDSAKDLYLIFVVEQIENESTAELQRALDDNRVCRKICVERRGRSARETLEDISFFSTPATVGPGEPKVPAVHAVIEGLPQKVLVDLERRAPEQIVERLLKGEYANAQVKSCV